MFEFFMKVYRACVVAVIEGDDGRLFVGERQDRPGVWQLPQGGIDQGESAEEALLRELREEIGCDEVTIEKKLNKSISYDFPSDLHAPIAKKYRGQEQIWFHLKFKEGAQPSLEKSDHEFRQLDWKTADELLDNIVDWKRGAYESGFKKLNII